MPTASAPAALASSALAPCANTATRTDLPLPCGSTVEPRTFWSDFLASMPRFIDMSIDSLNLAVAQVFSSVIARSEEHTSELQSLMRISYAVFCLQKQKTQHNHET